MADGAAGAPGEADGFLGEWDFQRTYGPWSPLHPTQVAALFDGAPFTWWVAGGWSLEADARRPRRRHEDIDLAVLADEVDAVRDWLAAFHLWEPHGGALRPLRPGVPLREGREQLWVRRDAYSPWLMDLLLTPRDGTHWLYKRDHRVRLPLMEVAERKPDGVPYQRPEISLLFKAKHARDKDVGDLQALWGRLDDGARDWFRESLALTDPGHPWLDRTSGPSPD